MIEYGPTFGCTACNEFQQRGHTPECRARFRELLENDGLVPKIETVVEAISPEEASAEAEHSFFESVDDPAPPNLENEALSHLAELDSSPTVACCIAPPGGAKSACSPAPSSTQQPPGPTVTAPDVGCTIPPDLSFIGNAAARERQCIHAGRSFAFDTEEYCRSAVQL